jgi:peptidoglycan/LPS O-acetylase OafA/YrhL
MKIRSLQGLRGLAVMLVVASHVSSPYGIEARYISGPRLTQWIHVASLASVDLFFIISGTIITVTTWERFGTPGACRDFVYRRVTRIYPPYWIVTSVILVIFLVRPDLVNSHSAYGPQVVPSFLILPQSGDPLVGVGWTLVYELYFYAVFALALVFSRRWLPWIIGAWAIGTEIAHLVVGGVTNSYVHVLSNVTNLEFVFGVLIGYLVVRGRMIALRAALGVACMSLIVLIGYLYATGAQDFSSLWLRVVTVGPALSGVVYAVVGLELTGRLRVPRLLERLGDASYAIYLWHVLVMSAIGIVLAAVLPHSIVFHVLALIAVFAVAVASGVWLYETLERPLLRAFHTRTFAAPSIRRALGARRPRPRRTG